MNQCANCGADFQAGNYNKGRAHFCRLCRPAVKRARQQLRRAGKTVITPTDIVAHLKGSRDGQVEIVVEG